ncbi:MAG TPA: DinB family protein [Gemmatimonadaceae bacterium]|jgi:hypothetical protein
MEFDLREARAVLERTPRTLDAFLRGLPTSWTTVRDGDGTWSPHEIVAHLISGERTNWIPRAQVVLDRAPARSFVPFDRDGFFVDANAMSLGELLDLFAHARADSLVTLDRWKLGDAELSFTAQHPTFGEVSLRQLLSTWVAHDLAHIVQISRTMARRYASDVGPWSAFLSVVQPRTGPATA